MMGGVSKSRGVSSLICFSATKLKGALWRADPEKASGAGLIFFSTSWLLAVPLIASWLLQRANKVEKYTGC